MSRDAPPWRPRVRLALELRYYLEKLERPLKQLAQLVGRELPK